MPCGFDLMHSPIGSRFAKRRIVQLPSPHELSQAHVVPKTCGSTHALPQKILRLHPLDFGGFIRWSSRQIYRYLIYADAAAVDQSSMFVTGTSLPWTGIVLLSVTTCSIRTVR